MSGCKGGEAFTFKNKSTKKIKHKRTTSLYLGKENLKKVAESQKILKKHIKEFSEVHLFFNSPIPEFLTNNQTS